MIEPCKTFKEKPNQVIRDFKSSRRNPHVRLEASSPTRNFIVQILLIQTKKDCKKSCVPTCNRPATAGRSIKQVELMRHEECAWGVSPASKINYHQDSDK